MLNPVLTCLILYNLVVVQDEDECEDEDYEDEEDADDEVIEEGCYHMMPRKQNCRHLNDTQVSFLIW